MLVACNDKTINDDILAISLVEKYQISINEPSGLTYNIHDELLYVVSDKSPAKIYTINTHGELLDSLEYFGNDLEAIVHNKIDSTFWISEESLLQLVKINHDGNEIYRIDLDFLPNSFQDIRIEGLGINYNSNSLYLINEKNPGAVIEIDLSSLILKDIIYLDFASDYSGAHYSENDDTLIIISDEDSKVFFWKFRDGIINSFDLSQIKAEGISIYDNHMYIINEGNNILYEYLIIN